MMHNISWCIGDIQLQEPVMQVQGNMQQAEEAAAHTAVQLPEDLFPGKCSPTRNPPFLGGRREYYDLCEALAKGKLKAAKDILMGREYLLGYRITPNMETPLHIAIMSGNTKFVRYLVNIMSKSDLELVNSDGNTAFCLAASSGNVEMAKAMLLKNPTLLIVCGSYKMTPLCLAALHGKHNMAYFLYDKMKNDPSWTEHRNEVFLTCIEANMLDVAIRILEDNKEFPQDKHEWDVLRVLAQNPGAFASPTRNSKIKSCLAFTGLVTSDGILLLRLLLKRVAEKPMDEIHGILRYPVTKKDKQDTDPSHVLFIAAKKNKQFLVELIHEFPDLIWLRNDGGQTIFHTAIAHRQHDVYRFLKNIGSIKGFITPIIDNEGNNILHMVGKIPEKNGYKDAGITPLEILSEYLWYKDVESKLPPHYRKMKNKAGHTPEEEFIKGHMEVVSTATKCLFETINQSMVVAVLICTVGFSILYSIPGGFDQSGFPVFRENRTFIWFILVEAISFLLAGISALTFINVILTRHDHRQEILLERWLAGQEALYASIAATTIGFLSGVFLLYCNNIVPYIISGIAIGLFAIYIKEYYYLLKERRYVIFKAMYFFQLKKYMI